MRGFLRADEGAGDETLGRVVAGGELGAEVGGLTVAAGFESAVGVEGRWMSRAGPCRDG